MSDLAVPSTSCFPQLDLSHSDLVGLLAGKIPCSLPVVGRLCQAKLPIQPVICNVLVVLFLTLLVLKVFASRFGNLDHFYGLHDLVQINLYVTIIVYWAMVQPLKWIFFV